MSDLRKEADDAIEGFKMMTDAEFIETMNSGLEAQLPDAPYHQGRVLKYLMERTSGIAAYLRTIQELAGTD